MPAFLRLGDYFDARLSRLESRGAQEARLNLEHLLARRLGIPRLELRLHTADSLPERVCRAADADIVRLLDGEPLHYILGDADFMGLTIRTDRRALIPRPETEWLVEQALRCEAIWASPRPLVADVGAGTGCIAFALAAARPAARIVAIERDPGALSLALENRAQLGLDDRVELRQGDLLDGIPPASMDAVVSNPPYIPTGVWGSLDRHVRDFEPRAALDGGEDGLAVIRRLAVQARSCLKPERPLWLEVGYDQGAPVLAILRAAGFRRVEIRRDPAGHDRAAAGWAGANSGCASPSGPLH